MKTDKASVDHSGSIRAGPISLLVPTLLYLSIDGLSDGSEMWVFIISFAVCFVLITRSIVELLVLVFTVAAKFSGRGAGHVVRFARRHFYSVANAV